MRPPSLFVFLCADTKGNTLISFLWQPPLGSFLGEDFILKTSLSISAGDVSHRKLLSSLRRRGRLSWDRTVFILLNHPSRDKTIYISLESRPEID